MLAKLPSGAGAPWYTGAPCCCCLPAAGSGSTRCSRLRSVAYSTEHCMCCPLHCDAFCPVGSALGNRPADPRHYAIAMNPNVLVYLQRKDAAGCLWLRRQNMQLPCIGRRRSPHRPRLLQDSRRWDVIPLQIQLKGPCAATAHAMGPLAHPGRSDTTGGVLSMLSMPDKRSGPL